MAFNLSRLEDSWCIFLADFNVTDSISGYYTVTLTVCVVTSLLAPITVIGNAFILVAIWKNPSLRTPSYVLLAGLSFTDFCSGLLTQPFYVVYKLAELAGWRKLICIAGLIAQIAGYYFSSLTVIALTITAVERWLHMSRRSLLTVRRVVMLYVTFVLFLIVFFASLMYYWYHSTEFLKLFITVFVFGAALCFFITVFAYFKVFRIIRHHQSQIQTNQNAIDIGKYKKSVFTILCILTLFLLSYVPHVCGLLAVNIMGYFGITLSPRAAMPAFTAIVFSASFFNPLLYYWRIKEIRDSVRRILRNVCCKETEEE
ncbi:olfactory receptor 4F21-like [Orbicella faveolata]|uniref:olfactory receptor 4F21-like n=1 Tax=Orbicella faveolata TaxID=48498 RepID=UPI0009E416F6|nr:olfactory receptor 4F21-like [Orbicella faveolata]